MVTGVKAAFLATVCCSAAFGDTGFEQPSVPSGLQRLPSAVVEELRQDLHAKLRENLLVAMRVEIRQVVKVVKASPPAGRVDPDLELAVRGLRD